MSEDTVESGGWRTLLWSPVDAAGLVWVRVCTGAILFWEVCRYVGFGWLEEYYIQPTFHFTYYGFSWARPWPGIGMYVHFAVLGLLALCMTVGLCYRLAAALFFLGFTYFFLLDQANYLNHLYLVCLLCFWLPFLPANRLWSMDVWLGWVPESARVPSWTLWLVRVQVGMVYVWGGVAKLNGDWLRAMPMLDWLESRRDMVWIGPLLAWDPTAWAMSYLGVLLDLFLVPLLLWRRTRGLGLLLALCFHALNNLLFSIGVFPYLMFALTLTFCAPDWPRRVLRVLLPSSAGDVSSPSPPWRVPTGWRRWGLEGGLALYLLVQVALPLRHWVYPGEVSWTEEGHRLAWHMKLRSKSARAHFRMREVSTGRQWAIRPEDLLTARQARKMASRPDMILQFCHHIAAVMRARGHGEVEVYAEVTASLNGRPWQPLVDPTVNLAAEPRVLWPPADWIVPLQHPLPGPPGATGSGAASD